MHWKHKAFAFRLFDHLPLGHHLHYLSQRHITRTLPRSTHHIAKYNENFLCHLRHLHAFSDGLSNKTLFEFGAGWDLCSNIAYYCFGIDRQIVVDVQRLARSTDVNHAIAYYQRCGIPHAVRRPPTTISGPLERELYDNFGITYLAPYDASHTALADHSIDFIVSTATLEHIPVGSIRDIMTECGRICKPDGVISLIIDYADHYSKSDKSITPFNFLKYEQSEWRAYNPRSHYQNRMRHCDYAVLFEEVGFDILEEEGFVKDADIEAIKTIPLATPFRSYRADELVVTSGRFVLRKKRAGAEHDMRRRIVDTPCTDDAHSEVLARNGGV